MKWDKRGRSSNLEDRRGGGVRAAGGVGVAGIVIVLLVSLITKQNPLALLGAIQQQQGGSVATEAAPVNDPAEEEKVEFVSFILDDAQTLWTRLMPSMGKNYRDARLVLFRNVVQSGCGNAQSAMGPFYCPADERVYIDLGFYDELASRFQAPGDFAEAYVLAHEVGHHVQNIEGTNAAVAEASRRRPDQANALSVLMELQADCYAGIYGAHAARNGRLEPGDIEEGLGAAAAVGDDRIQQSQGGDIRPESFTHGSSRQRVEWFRRGFDSGDPASCNTFAGR
ncbi:MAG TPA: neutral zinc metallopeptidase [Gemmatimonadales bacterium]|nr:neutral zinc metallopeptidase [Gemmatimonadales bacterium]